jgi:hypothetical protein
VFSEVRQRQDHVRGQRQRRLALLAALRHVPPCMGSMRPELRSSFEDFIPSSDSISYDFQHNLAGRD